MKVERRRWRSGGVEAYDRSMSPRRRSVVVVGVCALSAVSLTLFARRRAGESVNMAAPTPESPSVEATDSDVTSWKSTSSKKSALSVASVNSFCSIGSVNSAFSIGSVGSFASIGSFGSALSIFSALSYASVFRVGSRRRIGASPVVLKLARRSTPQVPA